MKLYYIIDIMNYKVVGIHRNEDAANKATGSQPQLEVHAVDPGDLYLVYTFCEPNTECVPEVGYFDLLPWDYCLFGSKEPDYESVAKERLNTCLNEIIKGFQDITMEQTVNFANAVADARDEYLRTSAKPDLKDQPFTHYSVRKVGKGIRKIMYHIVIALDNY